RRLRRRRSPLRIPSSTPERVSSRSQAPREPRGLVLGLLLLAALLSPGGASGQTLTAENRQRAAPLVQAATRAYQQGDHREAERLLAEAHAIYPSAKLRYSQARVAEALGHRVAALAWYREFLREVPPAERQPEQDRDAQAAVLRLAE